MRLLQVLTTVVASAEADTQPRGELEPGIAMLEGAVATLAPSVEPWVDSVLAAPRNATIPYLLAARLGGPSIQRLADYAPTRPFAQILARAMAESVTLELSVFDLDADGAPHTSSLLFVQSVDVFEGTLGEPVGFGTAHGTHEVPAGELRLTVVDPDTERHSVLRISALGAEILPSQVCFLRAEPLGDSVLLDGGSFEFGNPSPDDRSNFLWSLAPEEAYLEPFEIDVHEVSRAELGAFLDQWSTRDDWQQAYGGSLEIPRWYQGGAFADGHLAANRVSFELAVIYANYVGKRLPLEREWEFACSGGGVNPYPWGGEFDPNRVESEVPVPVDGPDSGQTPTGIERMSDNVYEWCADVLVSLGPDEIREMIEFQDVDGEVHLHRVYRGRSVSENSVPPSYSRLGGIRRSNFTGLRCARSPYPRDLAP